VQTYRVGRNLRLALVTDHLALEERKRPQCSHGLLKAVASKSQSEGHAKSFMSLREKKQRDRLRS
jgi:hypothetical protein